MTTEIIESQFTEETGTPGEEIIKEIYFQTNRSRELVPVIMGKMEVDFFEKKSPDQKISSSYPTFGEYCEIVNPKDERALTDDEISLELKNIKQRMLDKTLIMDSLTGVSDRTMYKFITEEFLKIEMCGELYDSEHRYIYEEFHSNLEYRVKKSCSGFLRSYFGLSINPQAYKQWKDCLKNYKQLKLFNKTFQQFYDAEIEFESLVLKTDEAILAFNISFAALHNDHVIISRYKGQGKCFLRKMPTYYSLYRITFPGLEEFG